MGALKTKFLTLVRTWKERDNDARHGAYAQCATELFVAIGGGCLRCLDTGSISEDDDPFDASPGPDGSGGLICPQCSGRK